MKNKYIFYLIIFLSVSNVIYAETLQNIVKRDDVLKLGNISILEYEHAKYIISVGVSTLDSSSASTLRTARIKSKLLSQQQLSKFVNDVNINTLERVEDIVVISRTDKGIKTRKVDSKYIEDIKETSEGPLTDIITIGDWLDHDKYYYAIGKKLVQK